MSHHVHFTILGSQLRDHVLRQHPLRHAHSLPVHHHGGLDTATLLGTLDR